MPDLPPRIGRLRKLLAERNVSALLVTSVPNVTYLTGFTGDDSYLLVTPRAAIILSDSRFTEQLEDECPAFELEIRSTGVTLAESVEKVLRSAKVSSLGIEATSLTVDTHHRLQERLKSLSLQSTAGLVEALRAVKDKAEIEAIRHAIAIAEKAFAVIRASLRPEATEKQVADDLEHQIRLFGGTCSSFPPIVGVGARASLPHGRPSNQKVGEGDFVLIDWGARAAGYISDLTRVLATTKISPKLERVHGVVLKAQLAGIAAIRPGAVLEDVDKAARAVIEKAGFGPNFGHGLGHGIGLQVHESPRFSKGQTGLLKPGMVVTVEPGIYLPGWGGVRIEDDILVTKSGHEVLSSLPKTLAECVAL